MNTKEIETRLSRLILENEGSREDIFSDVLEFVNLFSDDYKPDVPFIEDDFDAVWRNHSGYFLALLNGEDTVASCRSALLGLIGSKFDPRVDKDD